jgi:hypothetical protein
VVERPAPAPEPLPAIDENAISEEEATFLKQALAKHREEQVKVKKEDATQERSFKRAKTQRGNVEDIIDLTADD